MAKKDEAKISEVTVLDILKTRWGKDRIQTLEELEDSRSISTGSLRLDWELKVPYPPGIHSISGVPGVGKTTMSLEALNNAQRAGMDCFYVNMERAINKSIVGTIANLEKKGVLKFNPSSGEEALDFIESVVGGTKTGAFIVLDSIAAISSVKELEENMSDAVDKMMLQGKLMSVFLRKVHNKIVDSKSVVLLLNQLRSSPRGNVTPGGVAIKYWSTQSIYLEHGDPQSKEFGVRKSGDKIIGRVVCCKIEKNRYEVPFSKIGIPLLYGHGIDKEYELASVAIDMGIASMAGSWITVQENKEFGILETKVQGIEALANYLRENNKQSDALKQLLNKVYNN